MADMTFNTPAGQTIARDKMIAYINVGESGVPAWSPIGRRVEDSSMSYDWSEETSTDILGETHTSMKKPVVTQTFDPWDLDGGDLAQAKIWNYAVKEQNAQALTNIDMLIVHSYAGSSDTGVFAERYSSCMVKPTGLGGAGGGNIGMPIDVTYGGTRTIGTATMTGDSVTFTPAN